MKNLRPLLFFVLLVLIVASGCGSKNQNANGPKAIGDQPTATPKPEDTPAPQTKGGEAQSFFAEEFDNALSADWTPFLIYDVKVSDPEAADVQAGGGKLSWNIDTKGLAYYLL